MTEVLESQRQQMQNNQHFGQMLNELQSNDKRQQPLMQNTGFQAQNYNIFQTQNVFLQELNTQQSLQPFAFGNNAQGNIQNQAPKKIDLASVFKLQYPFENKEQNQSSTQQSQQTSQFQPISQLPIQNIFQVGQMNQQSQNQDENAQQSLAFQSKSPFQMGSGQRQNFPNTSLTQINKTPFGQQQPQQQNQSNFQQATNVEQQQQPKLQFRLSDQKDIQQLPSLGNIQNLDSNKQTQQFTSSNLNANPFQLQQSRLNQLEKKQDEMLVENQWSQQSGLSKPVQNIFGMSQNKQMKVENSNSNQQNGDLPLLSQLQPQFSFKDQQSNVFKPQQDMTELQSILAFNNQQQSQVINKSTEPKQQLKLTQSISDTRINLNDAQIQESIFGNQQKEGISQQSMIQKESISPSNKLTFLTQTNVFQQTSDQQKNIAQNQQNKNLTLQNAQKNQDKVLVEANTTKQQRLIRTDKIKNIKQKQFQFVKGIHALNMPEEQKSFFIESEFFRYLDMSQFSHLQSSLKQFNIDSCLTLYENLLEQNITHLTDIQEAVLSSIEHNIFVASPCSSGKMLALSLYSFIHLYQNFEENKVKVVIVTNKSYKCQSIFSLLRNLIKKKSKVDKSQQLSSLQDKTKISVNDIQDTTIAILDQNYFQQVCKQPEKRHLLSHINLFILDNAKECLLNSETQNQLKSYLKELNQQKQAFKIGVFTSENDMKVIQFMEETFISELKQQVIVIQQSYHQAIKNILNLQVFVQDDQQKLQAIKEILSNDFGFVQTLVFCNQTQTIKDVVISLKQEGFHAEYIIEHLYQVPQVQKVIQDFNSRKVKVLVTTQTLGSYLKTDNVMLVINYDIPTAQQVLEQSTHNTKAYLERVLRSQFFYPSICISLTQIQQGNQGQKDQITQQQALKNIAQDLQLKIYDIELQEVTYKKLFNYYKTGSYLDFSID